MALFSKKKDTELTLVLDVQSSVVRGSLVLMTAGEPPRVIFTYNANIRYKPRTDSNYLIKVTLRSVAETIEAAQRDLHIRRAESGMSDMPHRISSVHYALSSPWIVSQAKILSMAFPAKRVLSRQFVLGLIEEERAKAAAATTEPVRAIEEKIFDVRLNGYSVSTWEGKESTDLEVSFTVSVAGTRMIERFVEACEKVVPGRRVFFHSSLLLQHIGVEAISAGQDSYSLIHIHGELTDLAIVRRHVCAFFGSYPFGVRTLVRAIAAAGGIDEQAADSLVTLYTSGHLDQASGRVSAAGIERAAETWLSRLRELFAKAEVAPPGPTAVLMSAWAHDDLFMKVMRQAYPRITVDILSIDDIAGHVTFDAHAERRRLTGLYAMAIHAAHYSPHHP